MRDALSEISHYDEYDFLVVNDDFARALAELRAIVQAQRLRVRSQASRHRALLENLLGSQS
jgi:guanylate kinase